MVDKDSEPKKKIGHEGLSQKNLKKRIYLRAAI
jgi:hypothetical protein